MPIAVAGGGVSQAAVDAAVAAEATTRNNADAVLSAAIDAESTARAAADLTLTSAVAAKADLASPTFSGEPAAPTPLAADDSTRIATTAFVKAQNYAVNVLTTLGDLLYGGLSGVLTRLAGNTTTARRFLTQVGTGSASAAPSWFDLFGSAVTWTAQHIFQQTVIVRAAAGVAGTDEIQIVAPTSGTNGSIQSLRNGLRLGGSSGANSSGIEVGGSQGPLLVAEGGFYREQVSNGWIVSSDRVYSWSSNTVVNAAVADTAMARAAASVVAITNGSTAGGTLRSIPLTPTAIAADQNDYNPGVAWTYRLSFNSAGLRINSFGSSPQNGQKARFVNVGANSGILTHQAGSGTATLRFLSRTGADVTIAADGIVDAEYDGTTNRWRI